MLIVQVVGNRHVFLVKAVVARLVPLRSVVWMFVWGQRRKRLGWVCPPVAPGVPASSRVGNSLRPMNNGKGRFGPCSISNSTLATTASCCSSDRSAPPLSKLVGVLNLPSHALLYSVKGIKERWLETTSGYLLPQGLLTLRAPLPAAARGTLCLDAPHSAPLALPRLGLPVY